MADWSLDEFLYRVSLEDPAQWFMTFGVGLVAVDPPYHDIGRIHAFVAGFAAAAERYGKASPGLSPFFVWLRDETDAFPQNGWASALLARAAGDHSTAVRLLFDYLHQYAELRRPPWFVALNRRPVPSAVVNGLGTPWSPDIRRPEHVALAGGMPVGAGPAVSLSGFDLGDGFVMRVGLPPEVRSWWCVEGPRVALFFLSERATEFPQEAAGLRGTLVQCLEAGRSQLAAMGGGPVDACVLDVFASQARLATAGGVGAALVRAGALVGLTAAEGAEVCWETRPGDRLMVVSQPIVVELQGHGLGPLPPSLATAEPIAWAQCAADTGRRLALCVEWGRLPEAS